MPDIRVELAFDAFDIDEQYTTEDALIAACAQVSERIPGLDPRTAFTCTMPNGDRFLVDYFEADVHGSPKITELDLPPEKSEEEQELERLEAALEESGGRGVELAERIDELRRDLGKEL